MANLYFNTLTLEGPTTDLLSCLDAMRNQQISLVADQTLQSHSIRQSISEDLEENLDELDEIRQSKESSESITFKFETQRIAPLEWVGAMSTEFQTLAFTLDYEEEMAGCAGIADFKQGETLRYAEYENVESFIVAEHQDFERALRLITTLDPNLSQNFSKEQLHTVARLTFKDLIEKEDLTEERLNQAITAYVAVA